MANEFDNDASALGAASNTPKSGKSKPTKALPTDRMSFEKQQLTLRAVAKASLAVDRGGVSNTEVAKYAGIAPTSVSNCNSFWIDAGLLSREGIKMRPVNAIFEYDQAAEWTPEIAFTKLAPVLAASWFGKAMLTKLAIKPTTVNEALVFLAQECAAPLEYKPQLSMLLDYLGAAGLIVFDGNTVAKGGARIEPPAPPPGTLTPPPAAMQPLVAPERKPAAEGMKRITIALPDKENVSIELPEGFDADDWILVADHLAGYIKRWKKYHTPKLLKDATDDQDSQQPLA